MGKTETCLDIKHKKRGRPKLKHKMDGTDETMNDSNDHLHHIQIMSGTIQSPTITTTVTTTDDISNNNNHPFIPNHISSSSFSLDSSSSSPPLSTTTTKKISFCHQPIESFQKKLKENEDVNTNTTSTTSIITPIQLIPNTLNNNTLVHDNNTNENNNENNNNNNNNNNDFDNDYLDIDSDIKRNNNQNEKEKMIRPPKITLILSMEVCFARMTDDVTMAWGYYPQELAHRSIYDFIAQEDIDRLSRLHRLLLDSIVDSISSVNNYNNNANNNANINDNNNNSNNSNNNNNNHHHHKKIKHHQQQPFYYRKPPPPSERSTSELFHQKSVQELSKIANGSVSFNETIHIKTRSGYLELYDICMYIGGGLGGDLNLPSTLTKLYIVMMCHKHNKMEKKWPLLKSFSKQQRSLSSSPFKAIAPLLPSSSSSTTSTSSSTSSSSSSTSFIHRSHIKPAPHDLRQVILPAHFANNSKLNTISVNDYSIVSPKINVAPTTKKNNQSSSSSLRKLSSSLPSSTTTINMTNKQNESIITTSTSPSPTISLSSLTSTTNTNTTTPQYQTHPLSSSSSSSSSSILPSSSPSSTCTSTAASIHPINYPPHLRFKSLQSFNPSHHHHLDKSTIVNHPTTQYFLQTSSSNLNAAAASATKDSHNSSNSTSTNELSSGKKKGMSIRSLLC
ncbi:unnamed protein product [Cunninghamella blakesleeana]